MIRFLYILCFSLFIGLWASDQARAHFQLIYSPQSLYQQAGEHPFSLIFWHPITNGYAMDMEKPLSFNVQFRGKINSLENTIIPINFKGLENVSKAYRAVVPLKRSGDYHLSLIPAPYYEESEDIYIQQYTKRIINKGGVPSDWHKPLGLKTEIIALTKPYAIPVGGLFKGQVLSQGKPAANIMIEIEFIPTLLDMDDPAPMTARRIALPAGAFSILSDKEGYFSYSLPRAGQWGFAALDSGPDKLYNGKPLSQDAVFWVEVTPLQEEE